MLGTVRAVHCRGRAAGCQNWDVRTFNSFLISSLGSQPRRPLITGDWYCTLYNNTGLGTIQPALHCGPVGGIQEYHPIHQCNNTNTSVRVCAQCVMVGINSYTRRICVHCVCNIKFAQIKARPLLRPRHSTITQLFISSARDWLQWCSPPADTILQPVQSSWAQSGLSLEYLIIFSMFSLWVCLLMVNSQVKQNDISGVQFTIHLWNSKNYEEDSVFCSMLNSAK